MWFHPPRRRFVTACALAAALASMAAGMGAQSSAPSAQQPPTFRVNVDFVEVDAVVTDPNGNFVRDLAQRDFQVFEDGKPQTISTFSLVDLPVDRVVRTGAAPVPVEPDVRSNERAFEGRLYAMVIDDLHTNAARTNRVKAAARQFVTEDLGANDLMAVIHTEGRGNQDFTSNKRLLLAAIDETVGMKLRPPSATRTDDAGNQGSGREPLTDETTPKDPQDAERVSNAQRALATLRNVAQWFENVRGRRKAILFVSEGIDYDVTNWADETSGPSAHLVRGMMRDAIAAAGRGNASIYGIDARGLRSTGADIDERNLIVAEDAALDTRNAQESLRQLSDLTGGFAAVNQNDLGGVFDRIVHENSGYYVLAYYPPTAKPGAVHRIQVRVTRPGLTVRARQSYVTTKPAAEETRAAVGKTDALMTTAMRDALNSPMPTGGVGMSAFAVPFKGTAPNASVLVGIELRGRDLRTDGDDRLIVSVLAVDAKGSTRGGNTKAVPLSLQPEQRALVAATGLRLFDRLDLPPGQYQLRLAAQDARGGNVGSLLYDVEVPDFTKAPLTMSGIALTSAATSRVLTVRPDELLKDVLPAPAVTARMFPANDLVAFFAEIYDNQAATPHKVDLRTTVTSSAGTVVFKSDETRDSSEIQGRRGGYGYAGRVPLQTIPPGDYVLTVSATSRLGNGPAVERQVPFTVTAPRPVPGR